jgi:hypothetical protein
MLFGCAGSHQIACAPSGQDKSRITYYGIEINGVLCGFLENSVTILEKSIHENEHLFIMLSLPGSKVNTEMKMASIIDAETRKCSSFTFHVSQGGVSRSIDIQVKDDLVFITSSMILEVKEIRMTPDILFSNHEILAHLKKDLIDATATEKNYKILEGADAEVQESIFKMAGTEKLRLAGKTYEAVIFQQTNQKTGVKIKQWYDPNCEYLLKLEVSNRKVFLTDHTVVDKIKIADMDESIFTNTNVSIGDIHGITYMKLKVRIESTGVYLSI